MSKKTIKYCITEQIISPFEYSSSPKNSLNRQSNLFIISINSFEFQEISISVILKSNKNVSCSIWISTDLIKRSAINKKLKQKKSQFADPQGIINGPGMVNVKKNYVINGKISYLMIIFDYHYQIKINVNFSHGLS
jgi:hypothetical protein